MCDGELNRKVWKTKKLFSPSAFRWTGANLQLVKDGYPFSFDTRIECSKKDVNYLQKISYVN